ncbi:MAG TPA: hypothetical protein VL244_15610 [Alphaproteobacteria bacterium]|nr:hypothetical protein [Alphaproteobacteria bacterium]
MGIICGEAKARPALAAQDLTGAGERERASALQAFKQAIDALFEADSAERASLPVRRLFAIAHRPPLRLAALHGRLLQPSYAPEPGPRARHARANTETRPRVALAQILAGRRGERAAHDKRHGGDPPLARLVTSR